MRTLNNFRKTYAGLDMPGKKWKYNFLFFFLLNCGQQAVPQSNPVYIQTFGRGNNNPSFVGSPLPAGFTYFTYSDSLCPSPEEYTIIWTIPFTNCFNHSWINLGRDDSPRNLDYGLMMVVNNITNPVNRIVYKDTLTKNLCPGVTYHYGFAIINISSPELNCRNGPNFPVLEYRVEDGGGAIIKKDTIRPWVGYAEPRPPFSYQFNHYGFDFVPGGVTKLVLKLTLLHSTYVCAEDFAIDNIIVYPLGPDVNIAFKNEPATTIVKSVCFQQNESISFSGTIGSYYANTALQWQQSADSGVTWTDIPGATSATYSKVFSSPDTFLFRLTGAEAANIGNPNCRVASNTLKVQVDGLPKNYKITNNSPVCSGQDLIFNATGGASYIWTGPNGFYDNIPFPHIYFSELADSGTYYVDVFSLGGCRVKDSTHVTVIGTDVHAGPDTLICKGRSVTLVASQGITYSWTPVTGLSAANIRTPKAKPGVTTVYNVKVNDSFGCSDTANVEVKVLNKTEVKADISGPDYLCSPSDSALFKDVSTGNLAKWNWDFGNGMKSALQDPQVENYFIQSNATDYTVHLIVADSAGCADTTSHVLKVENNCYIAVPSAFTPNGDGLNDYLYPLNAYKATDLSFKVFNRIGQLVFETTDWTKKWDGKRNGDPMPAGVYVWMLSYTDPSNKKVFLKGFTLLMR